MLFDFNACCIQIFKTLLCEHLNIKQYYAEFLVQKGQNAITGH